MNEQCTCRDASFDDWFYQSSVWWDRFGFEEASDFLALPWQAWYDAGLTAQEGARQAHQEVFGEQLFDEA